MIFFYLVNSAQSCVKTLIITLD